jgi:hypothetical protein
MLRTQDTGHRAKDTGRRTHGKTIKINIKPGT